VTFVLGERKRVISLFFYTKAPCHVSIGELHFFLAFLLLMRELAPLFLPLFVFVLHPSVTFRIEKDTFQNVRPPSVSHTQSECPVLYSISGADFLKPLFYRLFLIYRHHTAYISECTSALSATYFFL
jgi:hypothetical protein